MGKELIIKCPHCKEVLMVDGETGRVIKSYHEKQVKEISSDFFNKSLKSLKNASSEREKRFKDAKEKEKRRRGTLIDRFEKEKDRVKEEGPIKRPARLIDFD